MEFLPPILVAYDIISSMSSLKTKWKRTRVREVGRVFARQLEVVLSDCQAEEVRQISPYLDRLFRRWYYTADPRIKNLSWAGVVEEFKTGEGWPEEGEFWIAPRPIREKDHFKIKTQVLFIQKLEEIPLVADLRAGKPTLTDPDYLFFFQEIQKIFKKQRLEFTPVNIFQAARILATISWWERSAALSLAASLVFLETLYHRYLARAYTDWVAVDDFFADLLAPVRKRFPFILSLEEAARKDRRPPKNEEEAMGRLGLFLLGLEFDRWFLTPLAGYLLLLEPFYQDPLDLRKEIEEFLEAPGFQEIAFFKPCASFRLTSLGKRLAGGDIMGEKFKRRQC